MPLIQFEYLTHTLKMNENVWGTKGYFPSSELNVFLNEKGAEGWELVSSTINPGYKGEILLIFKRPK